MGRGPGKWRMDKLTQAISHLRSLFTTHIEPQHDVFPLLLLLPLSHRMLRSVLPCWSMPRASPTRQLQQPR
jgi:hypothetical protein